MDRHDSLTEQLFLLAYDTGKGRLVSRSELGHALRAAVLADLLLAGHLTDERGKAAIGSPAPGTDPARDEILRQIREGRARSWQHWVARSPQSTTSRLLTIAALRSSSSSTMSRSDSRDSAMSTMPTAPSTIRSLAATTAPACWRCSMAPAISGA